MRQDNTIGRDDFNTPISDDEEEENIFLDNTSCSTQQASANSNRTPVLYLLSSLKYNTPATFMQRGIDNGIDGSIVNGQPIRIFLIQ